MENDPINLISIILVAKNAEKTIGECLARIRDQKYPREKIEILVIDGGSTDSTCDIAKNYGALVVKGGYPENQEARRYIGIKASQGDVLVFIDTDNFMPHDGWLEKMVSHILKTEAMGCFTKWYGIEEGMSGIDKYYALIGGNDPIAFYLGKNDRVPFGAEYLPNGAILKSAEKNADYVEFKYNDLPSLGCNGFLIKKKYVDKIKYDNPEKFFHTDVNVDLIKKFPAGQYAIVHDTILHAPATPLYYNLLKRARYKGLHSDRLVNLRQYKIFDVNRFADLLKLSLTIFAGLTLIEPISRAIIGYIKTKRIEWFYHPLVTFSMIIIYTWSVVKSQAENKTST